MKDNNEISYPCEGNTSCFQVEDHRFWFRQRNRIIELVVRKFAKEGVLPIAGHLISKRLGQYVRTVQGYLHLCNKYFSSETSERLGMACLGIPYSHIFIKCDTTEEGLESCVIKN
jgi:hypothetical protein